MQLPCGCRPRSTRSIWHCTARTRAVSINRVIRDYFSPPDAKADSKPPLIALMYHSCNTGPCKMPADQLNSFIAQRVEMMRGGASTSININLKDGTVLPDGGRMLAYTPVADLVRASDDPADAEYLRSPRGGTGGLARPLHAAQ